MESENAILGQILISPEILHSITLAETDFLIPECRRIFRAINLCGEKGIIADILTVADQDKAIDYYFLAKLTDIPSSANWKYYHDKVKNDSSIHILRQLGETLSNLGQSDDIEDVIGIIEKKLIDISIDTDDNRVSTLKELIPEFVEVLEQRYKSNGELPGFTTSLNKVTSAFLGFQKNRLYYIGGRPSQGKSALILNFASDMLDSDIKVGFMSAESSKTEVMTRLYAQRGHINSRNLITGFFSQSSFESITNISETLYEKDLIVYDKPNMSLTDVRTQARYMVRKHRVQIIFLDYIQIIQNKGREKKHERIEEISLALKNLSRELNIPIVSAAQLRRDVENRKPTLADFSDSSQIEKDADGVVMIYHTEDNSYLCIEKNRDGETGDFPVYFKKEYVKFLEKTREEE